MSPVDQILALTDKVQRYIDEGRWAEAGALENERLALLTTVFAGDDGEQHESGGLGSEHEQLARDLLARNAQMTATICQQRGNLRETTRRVIAGPGAVSAYRRNEPVSLWGNGFKSAPEVSE